MDFSTLKMDYSALMQQLFCSARSRYKSATPEDFQSNPLFPAPCHLFSCYLAYSAYGFPEGTLIYRLQNLRCATKMSHWLESTTVR